MSINFIAMRLVAIFIACFCCFDLGSSFVYSDFYHDKTRFDRSVNNELINNPSGHTIINKKPRTFTDYATGYTAYKDAALSVCYLEKLSNDQVDHVELWKNIIRSNKKTLYAFDRSLTKIEAWRLAGGRIADFCKGMVIILLQENKPALEEDDPFLNILPEDENDIVQKRVADVVLTPLKVRVRRRALIEERERLNQEEYLMQERRKREAMPYRGRFRGQTQSQYMNIGADAQKEGKAEAEATQQSSRAVVSGSSGMGQAQSMSSGNDGCEGCPGYDKVGSVPGSIQGMLGSKKDLQSGAKNGIDNYTY